MKAAVIDSLERGPRFADFAEPVVTGGETLVEVTAAGLHPIVRMLASGEHYGSQDFKLYPGGGRAWDWAEGGVPDCDRDTCRLTKARPRAWGCAGWISRIR